MTRLFFVLFGILAYAMFLATFLYLIGFVADFDALPRTIDKGPARPWTFALLVDLGLIGLFGIQHSVMARPAFKRDWTRLVPEPIERSVYLVASSVVLALVLWLWRPIPGHVWSVSTPAGLWLLTGLSLFGWAIVVVSTYLLNHFELFGLQQVWLHFTGRDAAAPVLRKPLFYRAVRHPLYSGFLLAFWATPVMSWGHLVFAAGMTAYVLIAIRHEERDLGALFGEDYARYQREVGAIVPGIGRR